jgi:amino acid transporter
MPPPPPMGSPFPGDGGRAGALSEVNGPAIGMIITAVLSALGAISSLGWNAMGMSNSFNQFQNFPAQNQQFFEMMQHYSLFSSVVAIALAVLIFIAGLKMKNLQSHTLCIVASILCIIPCTTGCCCVGIPIGIWALIVLNKPEVRDYFS